MSTPPINDIPPARRQSVSSAVPAVERRRGRLTLSVGLLSIVTMAGLGVWQWENLSAQARGIKSAIAPNSGSPKAANQTAKAAGSATDDLPAEELLHHRRYEEAAPADLVPLSSTSEIKLQSAAQKSVTKMIAQAKSEGVQLGIVSGFRSLEDQQYLFFDMKAERGETSKSRAEVSAPPGYSEHHTGYAVDFIDEDQPETHIEKSFEDTAAYRWLEKNAAFYNFEMSFPDDPTSPLSYEPWHWRYVGDQKSLELFYKE